ncbi:hypothetical protein C0Q70_11460 [Pomacea canaliculata]|uniref:Integrase zinc-binding domain-containing protein n=1 Tax=Pomacea canaliculata TaxID=400727 RepID=A0A2T7P614_POMCA|nr:hypothetical protein C0Q70_11460 [Pomacea canaliculata]
MSILTAKSAGRPVVHSIQQTARNTTPMSGDNDVTDNFTPAVEAVVGDPNMIPDGILEPEGGEQDFVTLTVDDWRRLQQQDPHIAAVCQALTEGTDLTVTGPETRIYARERKSLMLEHGVLYRRVSDATSTRVQLVVPRSMRQKAMRGVQDELYHTHFEYAIRHARMRFFWPFMAADLKRKIQSCEQMFYSPDNRGGFSGMGGHVTLDHFCEHTMCYSPGYTDSPLNVRRRVSQLRHTLAYSRPYDTNVYSRINRGGFSSDAGAAMTVSSPMLVPQAVRHAVILSGYTDSP